MRRAVASLEGSDAMKRTSPSRFSRRRRAEQSANSVLPASVAVWRIQPIYRTIVPRARAFVRASRFRASLFYTVHNAVVVMPRHCQYLYEVRSAYAERDNTHLR